MYNAYFIGGPLEGKKMFVRPEEPVINVPKPWQPNIAQITEGTSASLVVGIYHLIACDNKRMRSVYEWAGWRE